MRTRTIPLMVAAVAVAVPSLVTGQAAPRDVPLYDDLGDHHYDVTTASPSAQAYFDQGLRLYYAFNHQEAIRAFSSQFVRGDGDSKPATFLTRPEFLEGITARDRYYGDLAGFRMGEPLWSREPLAVSDPGLLLGGSP